MSEERTAVVTGAAHGIGRAVVVVLAGAGYDVLALDVDATALAALVGETSGLAGQVQVGVVDVADPASTATIPAMLGDRTLDVVVNDAGIGIEHPFYETSLEDWDRAIGIDLTGPFLVTRACWDRLRKPGGAVVNVSSIHGSRPLHHQAAYAAAKGGLENLTRGMALDAAPHGVRVNAVAPGFTRTRLISDWLTSEGAAAPRHEAEVHRIIPLGRMGEPDEVAKVVLWLAGPDAGYVTGAVVPVDGGLAARAFARNENP
jgi:NAD(P)-dependent dehydrogenase (short-subunit alcohol dehydrogenase family)